MVYEIQPYDRERFENLSDFVIKTTSGKKIKVHKFKLALHSEVFEKMLQHDCKESQKNEVLIEDFEDDTVEDFVDFLYQGKLEDGGKKGEKKGNHNDDDDDVVYAMRMLRRTCDEENEEVAAKSTYTHQLLSMAHKYQVQAMIDACSKYLQSHINKTNVANVWLVSEACGIPDLKESVHRFLSKNWAAKKECEGLVDVVKSHPEYMMDFFAHEKKEWERETKDEKEKLERKKKCPRCNSQTSIRCNKWMPGYNGHCNGIHQW